MQAPTAAPATSGADQYHVMTSGGAGGGTQHGTGCNCGPGAAGGAAGQQAHAYGGQQRQPGLDSTATVQGQSVAEAVADVFAPGTLDRQDAVLLWTGVNSVLFAALVYLEVRG